MVTTKGRRACALREREGHGRGSGHLEHFHFLTEVAAPQVSVFWSLTELHIVILCTFYRQVTLCHRERLRNLHTHPHPIIQPASYYPAMHRGRPGAWPEASAGYMGAGVHFQDSRWEILSPSPLEGAKHWRERRATGLCLLEAVCSRVWPGEGETSLLVTGSLSRVRAGRSVVGALLVRSQHREPFGAVAGAGLSETTSLPHVTSVRRHENPL